MPHRREWIAALTVAWVLILLRSAVFLGYEQSFFDSDQAIVGLMAKHLEEGRAFPLFFYGQSYMLGVEAWIAAPFLWLGGPTVASLRAAIVTLNLAAATLLITGLWKGAGVRPWYGLVATLFFAIAPPFTSALLVQAQGGGIEPFIYIALLWWLRERPLAFGAVLAVGFLNREFAIYAVPVILAEQLMTRRLFRAETIRAWLIAAVAFFAVWEGVNSLKPYADLMGPGTRGQLLGGFAGSQLADVSDRTSVSLAELPARVGPVVNHLFAWLMNGQHVVDGVATQGHDWLWWPIVAGLGLLAGRSAVVLWRGGAALARRTAFCWYLAGVGCVAVVAYAVGRAPTDGTIRYLLLSLLIPVGIVAGGLAVEPRRLVRGAIVAAVAGWAVIAAADNVALIRRYSGGTEPNEIRVLADALVARKLGVAEADYWRAYKLSFLTHEQLKVASTDVVRIAEYQSLAAAAGPRLLRIQEDPCVGGERIGKFYLCRPPR